MKALTLWEPWASALVYGPKDVENRPWRPYGGVYGEWVLIHAGQAWDRERAFEVLDRWREQQPETLPPIVRDLFGTAPPWGPIDQLLRRCPPNVRELFPAGVVIGAVRFCGALQRGERGPEAYATKDSPTLLRARQEAEAGGLRWWMREQAGWVREDAVRFSDAIPARGLQKLWNPSEEVKAACTRQLEQALRAREGEAP